MSFDVDVRLIRIIGTIALVFIYYREYTDQDIAVIVGCSLVLFLYIVLLWVRETWWNGIKYAAISLMIIAAALVLHIMYSVSDPVLLWPLVWILATVYGKYSRLSIALASITIAVILFISYPFSFKTLFILVGVFVGILIYMIRQDAYRMNQLRLQELNKAHKELQEAHAELQEAAVHSMRYAALEERTRLSREIHDGLGHQLTSLIVQLQALEIMLPDDPKKASETISQLLQIARQAMAEVRTAVREWSNDEMGLGLVALKGLVSQIQGRSSIKFDFVQDSEMTEWPIEISIVLYRVLQESLTNILRHSNATSVTVRIKENDDQIFLTIADNGNYTENAPLTPGFGLQGMMERCRLYGGNCTFSQEEPHGLRIEATLPMTPNPTDEMTS
ncbi:signal transduction histidine kinase [Scopulibacillus daqui]|uniref:histidine kinase n=1 Tax=Scopulibacillus daqui TaxID=1469162 RepID=A0ABS2PWQ5_9BACL|nr:sensor histidine kinase [Scopulibacillus daqui]MBM7643894.1 signal transduction histidine kinase [Scopulibacillus daqui]